MANVLDTLNKVGDWLWNGKVGSADSPDPTLEIDDKGNTTITNQNKDGSKIVSFFEDGKETRSEFDIMGLKRSETVLKGQEEISSSEFKYYGGLLSNVTIYEGGNKTKEQDYNQGVITKETQYRNDGSLAGVLEYDEKGKYKHGYSYEKGQLTGRSDYKEGELTAEYDAKGRLLSSYSYEDGGKTKTSYNEDGQKSTEQFYGSKNKESYFASYNYDEDGNLSSKEMLDDSGRPMSKDIYNKDGQTIKTERFDENGDLSKTDWYRNGKISQTEGVDKDGNRYFDRYDNDGKIIETCRLNDNADIYERDYYDKDGNYSHSTDGKGEPLSNKGEQEKPQEPKPLNEKPQEKSQEPKPQAAPQETLNSNQMDRQTLEAHLRQNGPERPLPKLPKSAQGKKNLIDNARQGKPVNFNSTKPTTIDFGKKKGGER